MTLADIQLYCEDEERRPTVRLLFVALQTLRGRGVQVAGLLAPRPTGSKEDVKVRVRHARRDRARAVSLRDRDFLLTHAERRGAPEALVADLGPLLTALDSVPSSAW